MDVLKGKKENKKLSNNRRRKIFIVIGISAIGLMLTTGLGLLLLMKITGETGKNYKPYKSVKQVSVHTNPKQPSKKEIPPNPMLQKPKPKKPLQKEPLNPANPLEDRELVGKYVYESVQEAVKQIVEEEKRKIRKELLEKQKKMKDLFKPTGKIFIGGDEKKQANNKITEEQPVPPTLNVISKIVMPDGTIILKTNIGSITEGSTVSGWEVIKITDKYVYLSKKKKVKKVRYYISL